MNYYIERLNIELKNILSFWSIYAYSKDGIAPEVSGDGLINKETPLGTVYLSRIIYGVSAACKHLNNIEYKQIADTAHNELITKLAPFLENISSSRNPDGVYYWALVNKGTILHDEMNITYAQVFVLFGLAEYYELSKDLNIKNEIDRQAHFIDSKLLSKDELSYSDGYSKNWQTLNPQLKSFGTHIHILEVYTRLREMTEDKNYNKRIESIIELILQRFISTKTPEVIHQFNNQWKPLSNEDWIGHVLEINWILCKSAKKIENPKLYDQCKEQSIRLFNHAIKNGFDKQYGGLFNRVNKNKLVNTDKELWTQTELVLGFINAYFITTNKTHAITTKSFLSPINLRLN